MEQQQRLTANDFHPEILKLFDRYVHGMIDRRGFLDGGRKFAVGGMTAAAILQALSPNYAWAEQVPESDKRIATMMLDYDSPKGQGKMKGYFAKPANLNGKVPGVVVVHENRGLTPYIKDVARVSPSPTSSAFAPDALTPLGGYPGNDDKGVEMQRTLDQNKIIEDFIEAVSVCRSARSARARSARRLLLRRQRLQPACGARALSRGRGPVLRRPAQGGGRREDQCSADDSLRRPRRACERRLACV
jgi:carboxymethylenebutenolidase